MLDGLGSKNLVFYGLFWVIDYFYTKYLRNHSFFQVQMGQLCGWGTPEWLPGHRLPSLPTGWSTITGCRALRALHGGTRRLRLLPSTILRPDALGMRPPFRPTRTWEVLREVPALHAIHSGKRVPTGRELLLHLWVQALQVSLHLSCECSIYGESFWRMVRGGNAFEHLKTRYRFIVPQTMRWMLTLWFIFEPSFSTTVMNTFQFMLWTAKLAAKPLRVFLASP